ncbi:MAG: hypothetical protein QF530_12615 [SAR202 cluster bacterium]|nr:hypothetical protein [SAR202 cluster bacterium]
MLRTECSFYYPFWTWQQYQVTFAGNIPTLVSRLSTFDEAIRIDIDLGEAYHIRRWAYQCTVKFKEAERDFAKAGELGYKP